MASTAQARGGRVEPPTPGGAVFSPSGARPRRRAYTAVELLATLPAVLVMLGLMAGLARHVRQSAADALTKNLLQRLDQAMSRYVHQYGQSPLNVPPLFSGPIPQTETAGLARRALANDQAVVRLLQADHLFPAGPGGDLPPAYYDGRTLRDAWGSPIVFMPRLPAHEPAAAPGGYFFSAGPDRLYTTQSDNLYSYELPGSDP
jgi:hypothetical protein